MHDGLAAHTRTPISRDVIFAVGAFLYVTAPVAALAALFAGALAHGASATGATPYLAARMGACAARTVHGTTTSVRAARRARPPVRARADVPAPRTDRAERLTTTARNA
jgi:hypothetical protein